LIAWCLTLHDADACHIIAVCACIDQGLAQVEAYLVDVFSCLFIVQGVDNEVELLEELVAKSLFLNFAEVGLDLDRRILPFNLVFQSQRFWLVDMFSSKEELSVEVADINGVQINNGDPSESGERETLDELTANTASADYQDISGQNFVSSLFTINHL